MIEKLISRLPYVKNLAHTIQLDNNQIKAMSSYIDTLEGFRDIQKEIIAGLRTKNDQLTEMVSVRDKEIATLKAHLSGTMPEGGHD